MQNHKQILTNSTVSFNMIAVKGGQFDMGGENVDKDSPLPVHRVEVSDFWMGEMLVTQALWEAVMGNNPSYFVGKNRPVEQVSWEDINQKDGFLDKLNKMTLFTEGAPFNRPKGTTYRLPTEAEWEYTARGGSESEDFTYAGSHRINEVAWFRGDSHRETKPVGLKLFNELGIYDMTGNVWEWCFDRYEENYNSNNIFLNPNGAKSGSLRVLRGGSWNDLIRSCRLLLRNKFEPTIRDNGFGFRLVLSSLIF